MSDWGITLYNYTELGAYTVTLWETYQNVMLNCPQHVKCA